MAAKYFLPRAHLKHHLFYFNTSSLSLEWDHLDILLTMRQEKDEHDNLPSMAFFRQPSNLSRTGEAPSESRVAIGRIRAFGAERYKQLVFQFLTSKDPTLTSKYILGPFDLVNVEDLEKKIKTVTK